MGRPRRYPLSIFFGVVASVFLVATGCSASTSNQGSATGTADPLSRQEPISGLLAASELLVGENRFPFGIVTPEGQLVEGAEPHVRFFRIHEDGSEELKAEADAAFREIRGTTPHSHEDGFLHMHEDVQGVYVVDRVSFDEPGFWRARFEIGGSDGSELQQGSAAFEVREESATFQVGDAVPPSRNPTARDVTDLAEITTHVPPVPGFYELTIAEALEQGEPFVVVFATPAFCISRMCGPVTDMAAQVYEGHKEEINFIHIEPWVLELARNEGRLVLTDLAQEWRLPSEPWVFVVGADGRVSARFEGLVTAAELEAALP